MENNTIDCIIAYEILDTDVTVWLLIKWIIARNFLRILAEEEVKFPH